MTSDEKALFSQAAIAARFWADESVKHSERAEKLKVALAEMWALGLSHESHIEKLNARIGELETALRLQNTQGDDEEVPEPELPAEDELWTESGEWKQGWWRDEKASRTLYIDGHKAHGSDWRQLGLWKNFGHATNFPTEKEEICPYCWKIRREG